MRVTGVFWLLILALLAVPAAAQNRVPLPADQEKTRGYFCAQTKHDRADEKECNQDIQDYWTSIRQWWSRLSQKDAEHCTKSYQLDSGNPFETSRHLADCVRMALGTNNQQYTSLAEVQHMIDPRHFPEPGSKSPQAASSHPPQTVYTPDIDTGHDWFELWPFAVLLGLTLDIVAWVAAKPSMRRFAFDIFFIQVVSAGVGLLFAGATHSPGPIAYFIFVIAIPLGWALRKSYQISKAEPVWEGRETNLTLLTFVPTTVAFNLLSFCLLWLFLSFMLGGSWG